MDGFFLVELDMEMEMKMTRNEKQDHYKIESCLELEFTVWHSEGELSFA